jgi:acyl-CoA synthetase (AMP-forming)/AMP-acid ligase II
VLTHDFLRRSAERTPDATAIVDAAGSVTYAALEDQAVRVANALVGAGVQRGDRVAIGLDNSRDFAASYFGVLQAGAVAVPVPADHAGRLEYVLRDCTPVAAILEHGLARQALAAIAESSLRTAFIRATSASAALPQSYGRVIVQPFREAVASASAAAVSVRMIDLDLAAIIYTSGSTGSPRGVMLSHLNIRSNTESIVSYLALSASDRMMVVLPFHYVYGLSLLHTHVYAGGSLVIDNRFAFPNVVLKAMQHHEVTGFAGVPSTFAILLSRSSIGKMQFPALRYVTQAGGALAPARVLEWQQTVPGVPLYVMYGATEASARLSYLEPSQLAAKLGSLGRAIPNVELLLLRDDGQPAGAGDVGEIVARGSNIAQGYWNRPDETREAFGPLGYHTGDLARADEDGYLYLVGRRHDMIKVGGYRVSAREIEDVLHEHAAIHEAAVVGAPHDILGEAPLAFVSLRQPHGASAEDLVAFCRRALPEYRVPSEVIVLDGELPKNGSGKVDKVALRRLIGRDGAMSPVGVARR